ncbi:hypothetical protein Sm713_15980 [Streptomyces sp. TS71-3]|nr:hypothetical protein Sm713_15980 [Streptomyces sp. TS71-3]
MEQDVLRRAANCDPLTAERQHLFVLIDIDLAQHVFAISHVPVLLNGEMFSGGRQEARQGITRYRHSTQSLGNSEVLAWFTRRATRYDQCGHAQGKTPRDIWIALQFLSLSELHWAPSE